MSVELRSEAEGFLTFTRVLKELKEEFPSFEIRLKSKSVLMRAIDIFLKVITLWRMSSFMQRFATTVGTTIYVSAGWESSGYFAKAMLVRHEAVHMRQLRRLGFPLYALTYLLLPCPIVWAAGRRNLEMEAYTETLRAYADYYGPVVLKVESLRSHVVSHFMGASYFWMWPFRKSLNSWYDGVVLALEKERSGDAETR